MATAAVGDKVLRHSVGGEKRFGFQSMPQIVSYHEKLRVWNATLLVLSSLIVLCHGGLWAVRRLSLL